MLYSSPSLVRTLKGHPSYQATPTKGHPSYQATPTKGHPSYQATPTKGHPSYQARFQMNNCNIIAYGRVLFTHV